MTHTAIDALKLSVYCTQADRREHRPLYEWLVDQALRQELAGATVRQGVIGFGRHRRLHTQHLLTLADDLPVVVELIDEPAKIEAFLDSLDDALAGYTYLRETVRWHRPNQP
jgi:hypothetical protein